MFIGSKLDTLLNKNMTYTIGAIDQFVCRRLLRL